MKWLLSILLVICPALLQAQSRTVLPQELALWVEVEPTDHTPYTREMVLITIKGIYTRHITRETLVQPDFGGFNWTQLGPDTWREERLKGQKVKTLTRRMAIYPNRPGTLTIGAFTHNLTLTDEADAWFAHSIMSEPVTIEVAPALAEGEWWFPVKTLKVSDQWSNAPDQLVPGEGVLRVVRIEALGATPEMIPPMPVLRSPSARIFPHPEKRFVELSPEGPLSYAFWRWTIRPGNDTSTIVEPLSFDYFDTVHRVDRTVTISAQRVAYGAVVPEGPQTMSRPDFPVPARLPGWPFAVLAGFLCLACVGWALKGRRLAGLQALRRFRLFDPLSRELTRAARQGEVARMRRAAATLLRREGPSEQRQNLLTQLDRAVFGLRPPTASLPAFARQFLRRG